MTLNPFEDHIYERIAKAIRSIPEEAASDIYALSFYVFAEDDDPRRMVLDFSYNTHERCRSCTPERGTKVPGWPIASDADEAKWNYAFWLQNSILAIGASEPTADEEAIELRTVWLKDQGLYFTDEEEEADFDRIVELEGETFREFAEICIRVAQRLHSESVIRSKFGHDVPVIIHDLEYVDEVAVWTRRANPHGLTQDFEKWMLVL
jgi:hypothetical protein